MKPPDLKGFLVRVLAGDTPIGAGFLATRSRFVTCAHVAARALGVSDMTESDHEGDVLLDFPLLEGHPRVKTFVEKWVPVRDDVRVGEPEDIAILELVPGEKLPMDAVPAQTVRHSSAEFSDRPVRMFGFPVGLDQGTYVDGTLKGMTGKGNIEIHHLAMNGRIEGGFSGTPVLDTRSGCVAGLVVSAVNRRSVETAYMIPVSVLGEVFPEMFFEEPSPFTDPANIIRPGGAIDIDSPFYVERDADIETFREIQKPRSVVNVRGARQTGKTSLLLRVYAKCREAGVPVRPVFIDFQIMPPDRFDSLEILWKMILEEVGLQLGCEFDPEKDWPGNAGYDRNLSVFFARKLFRDENTPLLFCLDEVDRVFAYPVKTGFFSSVRAFYNRGAFDPTWKRVNWMLSSSTEPAFFIEDIAQSPFNIGIPVRLAPFDKNQVAEFARRFGMTLSDSDTENIIDYVGGQPYLLHLLLYNMATCGDTQRFFDSNTAGDGIFRPHLNRFLARFQEDPGLADAMKSVIQGKGCRNVRIAERLEAAGLARLANDGKMACACRLYREFFEREL